ncbi:hypothetical protein SOJ_25400 [Staphylococcus sp. OJ82]|uniref:hypothetical protein n=1 Tax=Staphylococcus sp. OJ82 TaxID=1202667 RepID=UPI000281E73D|nr:hypothetical protein [Staphylococcus sp. OJ82]EJX17091.1 hypothetical protein SOJ_25400 [Staphylococcus sp. OJ82]
MEIILLLITSGIPGFYTYYSLSSKNIIYYNSDNKNVILSFFSIISILIFLLILSLFSGINNVNELFNNLSFTKISLSLFSSIILVVLLTEIIYPLLLDIYNRFINTNRARKNLSLTNTLPIHIKRYENDKYMIYVIIKEMDNSIIDEGIIESFSKKSNRNIIISREYSELKDEIIKTSEYSEVYIDFENRVKLDYYFWKK